MARHCCVRGEPEVQRHGTFSQIAHLCFQLFLTLFFCFSSPTRSLTTSLLIPERLTVVTPARANASNICPDCCHLKYIVGKSFHYVCTSTWIASSMINSLVAIALFIHQAVLFLTGKFRAPNARTRWNRRAGFCPVMIGASKFMLWLRPKRK